MTTRPRDEPIVIRRAETPADYAALQHVQREAWGIVDESYLVPVATLVGANRHGGLVLGAYLGDGTAVGVSFAFLGRVRGQVCLYSQLTGIAPGYQDRGLGTKLKLAQRDFALREGLERIAWSFDPLQAGNARFNLAKLGASCREYYPDLYGHRSDRLNPGVPTDRLLAEWEVTRTPRGPAAGSLAALPRVLSARRVAGGELEPVLNLGDPEPGRVGIEVPTGIGLLREQDPERASRWLFAVRQAFRDRFDRGDRAVDFIEPRGDQSGVGVYLLERGTD